MQETSLSQSRESNPHFDIKSTFLPVNKQIKKKNLPTDIIRQISYNEIMTRYKFYLLCKLWYCMFCLLFSAMNIQMS